MPTPAFPSFSFATLQQNLCIPKTAVGRGRGIFTYEKSGNVCSSPTQFTNKEIGQEGRSQFVPESDLPNGTQALGFWARATPTAKCSPPHSLPDLTPHIFYSKSGMSAKRTPFPPLTVKAIDYPSPLLGVAIHWKSE